MNADLSHQFRFGLLLHAVRSCRPSFGERPFILNSAVRHERHAGRSGTDPQTGKPGGTVESLSEDTENKETADREAFSSPLVPRQGHDDRPEGLGPTTALRFTLRMSCGAVGKCGSGGYLAGPARLNCRILGLSRPLPGRRLTRH